MKDYSLASYSSPDLLKTLHHITIRYVLSILIYKGDTNFWDGFFIIPILPLKKTTKKKLSTTST
jgi:hypothetical protein